MTRMTLNIKQSKDPVYTKCLPTEAQILVCFALRQQVLKIKVVDNQNKIRNALKDLMMTLNT